MIKAVIFDFDGTLSNRKKNAYETYDAYFREYFKDLSEIEYEALLQDMMFYDADGTVNMELRMIPFLHKYGKDLPEDFVKVFSDFYINNMFKRTPLKDETLEVIQELRKTYKIAILSNGDPFSQHHKIQHVQIEKYFDEVMVSGDIGIHKPDPKIFDLMAQRLGVRNEECLMVGDVFSTDILGATRAGMTTVWMCTDFERPAQHYKGYRIKDLRELFNILKGLQTA